MTSLDFRDLANALANEIGMDLLRMEYNEPYLRNYSIYFYEVPCETNITLIKYAKIIS